MEYRKLMSPITNEEKRVGARHKDKPPPWAARNRQKYYLSISINQLRKETCLLDLRDSEFH